MNRKLCLLVVAMLSLAGSVRAADISDLPVTLQGNVVLWNEASTSVTTDAFGVTNWQNIQGTAGRDFSQTGNSFKPQLVNGAINGLPVVRFDGMNDGTADHLDTTDTSIMANRSQFEMFLVANIDSNSDDFARILSEEGSGAGNRLFNYGLDNTSPRNTRAILDTTGATANLTEPTSSTGAFHIYGMRLDSASGGTLAIDLDGNGVSAAGSTVGSLSGAVDTFLRLGGVGNNAGSNDFADVDVAEVLIFDRSLTASERNAVGHALGDKYALATAFNEPVNTTPVRTMLIDFNGANANSENTDPNGVERWNDVNSYAANSTLAADLVDTSGASTGVDLAVGDITAGTGTAIFGGGGWDLPGVLGNGFPESATRDGMVIFASGGDNISGDLQLQNLDPNSFYDLEFFVQSSGIRDFSAWEINGVTGFISPNAPQEDTVLFEDIVPNLDGTIDINWFSFNDVTGGRTGANSNGRDAQLSLLRIVQQVQVIPEPASIALWGLLGVAAVTFGFCRRRRCSGGN